MIVIISYYADRKEKPEIKFIPDTDNQVEEVAEYMASLAKTSKVIKIYNIFNLGEMPAEVFPKK